MSQSKNATTKKPRRKTSNDIKSHANDPYIIKKVLDSEKVLKKYGFPKLPEKKEKVD
jgi:hypothetical protein